MTLNSCFSIGMSGYCIWIIFQLYMHHIKTFDWVRMPATFGRKPLPPLGAVQVMQHRDRFCGEGISRNSSPKIVTFCFSFIDPLSLGWCKWSGGCSDNHSMGRTPRLPSVSFCLLRGAIATHYGARKKRHQTCNIPVIIKLHPYDRPSGCCRPRTMPKTTTFFQVDNRCR